VRHRGQIRYITHTVNVSPIATVSFEAIREKMAIGDLPKVNRLSLLIRKSHSDERSARNALDLNG